MKRKAVGTDYIPGQARELQVWVDKQKFDGYLAGVLEEKEAKKDKFEIWMDSMGQAIVVLAIFCFVVVVIAQLGIWRGWW